MPQPPSRSWVTALAPSLRWADLSGRLLWGGVMLLVLGGVIGLQHSTSEPSSAPRPTDLQRPDYRLEHFSWDHYDAGGLSTWRLTGASLAHFPDGRSRVRQARLTQRPPDQRTRAGLLTLSAGQAEISGSSPRQLMLSQGAELLWNDASGQTRLRVRTGAMLWSEAAQTVSSGAPVQVSAQGQTWTAGGFVYDMARRTLSLQGRVRGVLTPSLASDT